MGSPAQPTTSPTTQAQSTPPPSQLLPPIPAPVMLGPAAAASLSALTPAPTSAAASLELKESRGRLDAAEASNFTRPGGAYREP
eukprot:6286062-Pyramimonas_sp.AAC.1